MVMISYPPMSFFVMSVFGSRIRNNHGNCGKNVAMLNATFILSALTTAEDAMLMVDDDKAELIIVQSIQG